MTRPIFIITLGLLSVLSSFAQQKPFGYRISGGADVISHVFLIQDGFVLDSATQYLGKTYRFEYYADGRLRRDINFVTFTEQEGRIVRTVPGYEDYFYNEKGDVDSVAVGVWNDSTRASDSYGYRIDCSYDNQGRIVSRAYSDAGGVYYIEKHGYDSTGNSISDSAIVLRPGYTSVSFTNREFDSQNRLVFSLDNHGSLYDYQYDSSGNVNYTVKHIGSSDTANGSNIHLTFDGYDRLHEVQRSDFGSDSTWGPYYNAVVNYDQSGRMLNFGSNTWFHYDSNGNLDTLWNPQAVYSLYPGGVLMNAKGNTIGFPEGSGPDIFYLHYSRLVTGAAKSDIKEATFALSQNYPNPFNPTTKIQFTIVNRQLTIVKVFDILGREVATLVNDIRQPGTYSVDFDGSTLASGVYFYRLQAGSFVETKKLLLLR